MKKYISVLISVILIFGCFGLLASCSLFEGTKKLELDLNFEEYESGTLLYNAEDETAQKFAAYSPEGELYFGKDYRSANLAVTDSIAYEGVKSMEFKVYNQYVTTPLKLLPNTKYTLSFFYYCKTEDNNCYLSRIKCGVYDIKKSALLCRFFVYPFSY